jgi:carboxyl-terminal processing protease
MRVYNWLLLGLLLSIPCAAQNNPRYSPKKALLLVYDKIVNHFVEDVTPQELLASAYVRMVSDVPDRPELASLLAGGTRALSLSTFQQVVNDVSRQYRWKEPMADIYRDAIRGMVDGLGDPFTSVIDYKGLMGGPSDVLSGIGITMDMKDGEIVITGTIDESSAYRIGLKSGDVILAADGRPILSFEDARAHISGPVGTMVEIEVRRPGVEETLFFTLRRTPLLANKNVQYRMLDDNVGYIKLNTFMSNRSASDLRRGLNYLNRNMNAKRFILDLRNNPGGLLDQAVDISGMFLRKRRMITTTRGRHPDHEKEFRGRRSLYAMHPLVVLVNSGSASASEIVTGAFKDQKRATIVGEKTYGKGSVQEIYQLGDGSALKLTIAKYYTPSGVCIHGTGIEPDLTQGMDKHSKMVASAHYHKLMQALPEDLRDSDATDEESRRRRREIMEEVLGDLTSLERELAIDPQLALALKTVRKIPVPELMKGLR